MHQIDDLRDIRVEDTIGAWIRDHDTADLVSKFIKNTMKIIEIDFALQCVLHCHHLETGQLC